MQDIRENAAELRSPVQVGETPIDASALPTSGLLSRDPGLVTIEGGARSKSSPSFVQRDQNVKEAAAQRIEGLRDPEADLGSVLRRAGQAREEMLAPADANLRQRAGDLATREQARRQQGAEFGVIANSNWKDQASSLLDRSIVDQNYVPARAQKNAMFDPPNRANSFLQRLRPLSTMPAARGPLRKPRLIAPPSAPCCARIRATSPPA